MPLFADITCETDRFVTIEDYIAAHRKKPLILAVIIHLFMLIVMLLPASFFQFNHKREEIYTVNLFEATESAPARQAAPAPPAEIRKKEIAPPTPPSVVKKVEAPPQVKKPVVVEKLAPPPAAEQAISTSSEVVSLKPRLVKKEINKPKVVEKIGKNEEVKVDQALDRIKNELKRKKAEQKAEQMQAEAAAAVDDAVSKIRESIHAQRLASATSSRSGAAGASATGSGRGAGSGGDANLDPALKLWYVAVVQKIHENWVLPPVLQDAGNDLEALVVVTVHRDGEVTKYNFEQKSNNSFFNQFVEKTLKKSLPLPPFPAGLEEDSLEIGLKFHPSGLE